MNIIHQLYDEKFVPKYLKKKVLPLYPDFKDIKKIEIRGIKNNIWEKTYHVVIEYKTFFIDRDGKNKKLYLYCSAHSNEQRKNVYEALKFLWLKGFNKGNLTIPHPLFYSQRFKGVFYRGVKGKNLYQYIREKEIKKIKKIIKLSAKLFAKLHQLNPGEAKNFNKKNSLIETTVPGAKHWLKSMEQRQPKFYEQTKKIFNIINEQEKEFFNSTKRRWLIHGDAHPENIIKISANKIGMIDFTDMCLADFARDLGAFIQQLEYMTGRHIKDRGAILEMKKIFIDEYLKSAKIKLEDNLEDRIKNYYNWTALRTVVYFLVKEHPEPDRAEELLKQLTENLNI